MDMTITILLILLSISLLTVLFTYTTFSLLKKRKNNSITTTNTLEINTETSSSIPPKEIAEHSSNITIPKEVEIDIEKIKTESSTTLFPLQSSIITTGENEYYKGLLQDDRWIQKRERRKRMDNYICQNCYNTIKLNDINELLKYVDFPKVADIIISVFNKESASLQYNSENLKNQSSYDTYKLYNLNEANYIPKYNIYLNKYHLGMFSFCWSDWKTIALAGNILIISSKELSNNDVSTVQFKSIKCEPFETKKYYDCDTIFVQYTKGNTTNDNIYLTFCYNYITGIDYNKRLVMLTKNDFAIIFPLYKLNSSETLEVHHKKYSRPHLPWDVKDEDLITLCHSCHIEANKKAISIE